MQSDLKREALIYVQYKNKHSSITNYKYKIDHTAYNNKCGMCSDKVETICHVVSECTKLAQREYKRRHDNIIGMIH